MQKQRAWKEDHNRRVAASKAKPDNRSESQKMDVTAAEWKTWSKDALPNTPPLGASERPRIKVAHSAVVQADNKVHFAADESDEERNKRLNPERRKAADNYKKKSDEEENQWRNKKLHDDLLPVSVGDIYRYTDKAKNVCRSLDGYYQDQPDNEFVKKSIKDAQAHFKDVVHLTRKLVDAAQSVVDDVMKASGGARDKNYADALKNFQDGLSNGWTEFSSAIRLASGPHMLPALEKMHEGVMAFDEAAGNAALLNFFEQSHNELMVKHLTTVKNTCVFMIGVLGAAATGPGAGLVRLAGVGLKTTVSVAEFSASKAYHTDTELTIGSIAANLVLELVFLGLADGFPKFVKAGSAPAIEEAISDVPPSMKAKVREKLIALAMPALKNTLAKGIDVWLGNHHGKKKKAKELTLEICEEYLKDLMGEEVFSKIVKAAIQEG